MKIAAKLPLFWNSVLKNLQVLAIADIMISGYPLFLHETMAQDKEVETWCAYPEKNKGITQHDNCIDYSVDGNIRIRKEHLSKMDFSTKNGLVGFYYPGGTGYVNRAGKTMRTFTFDNGPDYFNDGLARMLSADDKFGFINNSLEIVIPPKYDFAGAFGESRAAYCMGCLERKIQPEGKEIVGGKWGFIDKSGKVVEGPMDCEEFKNKHWSWLNCPN